MSSERAGLRLEAEERAKALLLAVRELGDNRPGRYEVRASLDADGNYHWDWAWYPQEAEQATAAPPGSGSRSPAR